MGVDVNQGASQIAQMLQPEQPSDSAPEAESTEPAKPAVEGDDAETQEPQEEVKPTTSNDEPETQEVTQVEEPEIAESDTKATYKVKVGGEEQDVTLEDLRKGYMMESDYRKKTSEVARQREEIQQKKAELAGKVEEAELLLRFEAEDLSSPENQELKEIDPVAYYEKREALEAKTKKLEELKVEAQKSEEAKTQETLKQEIDLVYQALPEWLDEDIVKSDSAAMASMYESMGLPQEYLDSRNTHYDLLIARKAALYDKLMSSKPESKKVTPKPKSATPSANKPSETNEAVKVARSKLAKTGSMQDGVAAIKQLMR